MQQELKRLLTRVLDDATADANVDARVWPIRAALYREISAAIGYDYEQQRAMRDEKYPR